MAVQTESLASRTTRAFAPAESREGRIVKIGTQVAVGVAIGYVLGRTRKMRLAMTLVSAGAIGRNGAAGELVRQGTKLLGSAPEMKELTENVRGRLMEAGKVAAMAAASNQINSLTDRLQERASSIQGFTSSGADEDEDEDRAEEPQSSRGRSLDRDDEEETESTPRSAEEDEFGADEEEDEERDTEDREEERQPAMSGGRGRRPNRGDEEETKKARPRCGVRGASLRRTRTATTPSNGPVVHRSAGQGGEVGEDEGKGH